MAYLFKLWTIGFILLFKEPKLDQGQDNGFFFFITSLQTRVALAVKVGITFDQNSMKGRWENRKTMITRTHLLG